MADKIAILDHGYIVKSGTPEELKKSLPQGVIEFSFQKAGDYSLSRELLNQFEQMENPDNLSLTIVTDGSIEQLLTIFNQIVPILQLPALQNQPLTSINESVRRLLLSLPVENYLRTAILWCIGLLITAYIIAIRLYKTKVNK